jgi:hypothetical protein
MNALIQLPHNAMIYAFRNCDCLVMHNFLTIDQIVKAKSI